MRNVATESIVPDVPVARSQGFPGVAMVSAVRTPEIIDELLCFLLGGSAR